MRRIVICCDGTWNTPDADADGVPLATNVVRVAEAVKARGSDGITQLLYYDTGVGTRGGRFKRIFGGATGMGLTGNLLNAYRFLVRHYRPGDQLFLFGFSRGAYTVRSLAGLIRNSGILLAHNSDRLEQAFDLYQARAPDSHPRAREATLFRRTWSHADRTQVHFLGVWDTVGALGNPLLMMKGPLSRRHRFHDTALSSTVSHAFHAVAIDEQRRHFRPCLWQRQPHAGEQTVEQCWFAGVHADIGGGYANTGLSDLALAWMAGKARDCGLDLRDIPTEGDVGVGPHNSRTGAWRLVPRLHRTIGGAQKAGGCSQSLHTSVLDRYRADSAYRPPGLVDYLRRHPDLAQGR